jgi:hypothetical protein
MPRPGPRRHHNQLPNRDWPSWRYGPNGESAIFQKEGDVPYGWTRKPGDKFERTSKTFGLDRDGLIAALALKGIIAHPTWSARHMKDLLDK